MVLRPESNRDDSLSLAKRFVTAVEQHCFELDVQITLSIGIGQLKETESIESWIERADRAVYLAKHEGRNRTETIG